MAIWRWPTRFILAIILLFVTFVGLRAMSEAFNSGGFPEALAVKLDLLPLIFPLHMITGGMALLLVPTTILLRGTRWHRWAGRLTAGDILAGQLTGHAYEQKQGAQYAAVETEELVGGVDEKRAKGQAVTV